MNTDEGEKDFLNFERSNRRQPGYCKVINVILRIIGLLLVIICIASIVILIIFWKRKNVTEIRGRFGIVIDAGGSGTRMHVYEYSHDNYMKELKYINCENRGIASYGNSLKQMSTSLKQCLKTAATEIPITVVTQTPLYLGGTGGMRILREKNSTLYENVWDTVRDVLRNGSFPVKLARTLDDSEEGAYSWSTVNILLGNPENTSGLFEVGSSSFQISFEPRSSETSIPREFQKTVVVNKQVYNIYAHSYLCFGKNEFIRRYKAMLIQDANYSLIVQDPCSFSGFIENVTSSYLWQSPCVLSEYARETLGGSLEGNKRGRQYYTLSGTGNFTKCYKRIISMFNDTNCNASCSINGVYQPTASGLFTAIGGGVYYSSIFLNISLPTTVDAYGGATKNLCSQTFKEVQKMKGYNKYVSDYCLGDVYNYFLFKNVLKLGRRGKITFADKIGGKRLTWALGLITSHTKEMSSAITRKRRELSDNTFYPLIGITSLILLLVGLTLIATKSWKKSLNCNKHISEINLPM